MWTTEEIFEWNGYFKKELLDLLVNATLMWSREKYSEMTGH